MFNDLAGDRCFSDSQTVQADITCAQWHEGGSFERLGVKPACICADLAPWNLNALMQMLAECCGKDSSDNHFTSGAKDSQVVKKASVKNVKNKYQKNLAAYRVKMAAYKAGQPVPNDEEAIRLVEAGKAPEHVPDVDVAEESEEDAAAAAQIAPVEETSPDTSPEPEPEPEPEPSPPKSKRRKL